MSRKKYMSVLENQNFTIIKKYKKNLLSRIIRFIKKTFKKLNILKKANAPLYIYFYFIKSLIKGLLITRLYKKNTFKFIKNIKDILFTNDWTSLNVAFWSHYININKKNISVLEIGSWEGLTTNFINWSFNKPSITCVDTWEGSDEHFNSKYAVYNSEILFDKNTKKLKVNKQKMKSSDFFKKNTKQFDLIYVDGSHFYDDVLSDCINSNKILNLYGYLVLDDYFWIFYQNLKDNPASAINTFLKKYRKNYQILHIDDQVILKKIKN